MDNLTCSEVNRTADPVSLALRGYAATLLILIGLAGNALIIAVVRRREMRAKANQSLIALAVWDSALLLAGIYQYSYFTFRYGGMLFSGNVVYVYLFLFPWSNVAKTGSVWTTLLMAFERYFAVAYPLKYKCVVTGRRIRYTLTAVCIAALVYCIPRFFEIEIVDCTDENVTVPFVVRSSLRLNRTYYTIVYVVLNSVFVVIGPFLTQAFLMARIGTLVRGSRERCQESFSNRKSLCRRRYQERCITAMLLALQMKFLICSVTPVAVNLTEKFLTEAELFNSSEFNTAVTVSEIFVLTNSAMNFPVYTIFTTRFRNTLKNMILRRDPPLVASTAILNGPSQSNLQDSGTLRMPTTPLRRSATSAVAESPSIYFHFNADEKHESIM